MGAPGRTRVQPARRACLLAAACARGSGLGARRALRSPDRDRAAGVAEGAQATAGPGWVRWSLALGFCFVLKPGVGEGQHLVNEKFPVRKTPLAEFLSCP